MINIAGTRPIDDPAYRYQMPRLQTKIEGRGNGIKTVVVNMNEIAQALHRDPAEVTKFFGCELGAQTTYSVDTAKSVVNGAHQAGDMQNHLGRYIEAFVLCSACRLPETQYKMKSGTIYQKCAACGAKEPVDMSHRLTTFITNAYKKAKKEKSGSSSDKKSRREKKKSGESKDESPKEKKSKKKKDGEKKSKKKKSSDGGSDAGETKEEVGDEYDEDDDDLEEDFDDLEIDDRSALDGAIDRFRAFLGATANCTVAEMADEIATLQTFSALRPGDRVLIYVGATFDENAAQSSAVEKHKQALATLSNNDPRQLIAAMEWFCGVRFPSLLRWFPAFLKHLYDEDLVEEEHFLAWDEEGTENEYSSPSLDADTLAELHAAAEPFLTWLREAEEDGDDDDDEEDDEED